jgi:hypothetical protein
MKLIRILAKFPFYLWIGKNPAIHEAYIKLEFFEKFL